MSPLAGRVVGYVVSGTTPRRVAFVVQKGARVEVGRHYAVRHPFYGEAGPPVLLRVYEITAVNEEMDSGRAALLATSAGLVPDYQQELEYLIAECEVLGYRDPSTGALRGLESPPPTATPVFEPDREELASFLGRGAPRGAVLRVGTVADFEVPFLLDLDGVARGHAFVAGMTRSGKSVSGDTPVLLYDVRAGEPWLGTVEEFHSLALRRHGGSGGGDEIPLPRRYMTLALDPATGEPRWSWVSAVLRHRSPPTLYEVVTDVGRRIRVTGDHSLLAWDGSRVSEVRAADLVPGRHWLLVPSGVRIPGRREVTAGEARAAGWAAAVGWPVGREDVIFFGPRLPPPLDLMEAGAEEGPGGPGWIRVRSPFLHRAASLGPALPLGLGGPGAVLAAATMAELTSYYDPSTGERVLFGGERWVDGFSTVLSLLGVPPTGFGPNHFRVSEAALSEAVRSAALIRDGGIPGFVRLPGREGLPAVLRELVPAAAGEECYSDGRPGLACARAALEDALEEGLVPDGARAAVELVARGGISFEEVVEVREVPADGAHVYDLSVPGPQNFLAGGVFAHNSSFVLNAVRGAMNLPSSPRFLVFDRRGEYEVLGDYGAAVLEYRVFLPESGLMRPEDLVRRAGIPRGTAAWRVALEAAEEAAEAGPLTPESVLEAAKTVALRSGVRDRSRVLRVIGSRLRRVAGELEASRGGGRDPVEAVRDHQVVVVDLSADDRYDDQLLAVRDVVRRLLRHAIARRRAGDFALIAVLEEAQYLVPERGAPPAGDPFSSGVASALTEAISQSGGYNLGFVVVTQRPAYVSKSVISQCNTVAAFRLKNGNDQEAISRYTEAGEAVTRYLPGLQDHEAVFWGMASPVPFPVVVRTEPSIFPSKAAAPPSEAWRRMASRSRGGLTG